MADHVNITNWPDFEAALRGLPAKIKARVLRNALAAGARLVRDDAKRAAPVAARSVTSPTRGLVRKPGTVRNAISVRTSKRDKSAGAVGVFISVLPAKGAKYRSSTTRLLGLKFTKRTQVRTSQRGAYSPNDPFYWRFLEFGTRKLTARPFMARAAQRLGAALDVIRQRFARDTAKLNTPNA